MNMEKTKICSEKDCYEMVDLEFDVVKNADGSYYILSLKCWNCRTDQDRKKIKRKRKEQNKRERVLTPTIPEDKK